MMRHARAIHVDGTTYHWQNRQNPLRIVIELQPGRFLTVGLQHDPEDWEEIPAITPRLVRYLIERHLGNQLAVGDWVDAYPLYPPTLKVESIQCV